MLHCILYAVPELYIWLSNTSGVVSYPHLHDATESVAE
jgi:hypothetical protein